MAKKKRDYILRRGAVFVLVISLISIAAVGTAAAQEAGPTVYIGDSHGQGENAAGTVYALNASDGSKRWNFTTDRGIYAPTIVSDGTVYVGDQGGTLYAIDASDGSEIWTFEAGEGVRLMSSPSVSDGTVYVVGDGTLYAVDGSDGSELWSFDTGAGGEGSYLAHSSPAVVDGTVYTGSEEGNVYAVDASDGSEVWRFETNGSVASSPTVVDGTVYFGNDNRRLYALDADEGTELWNITEINAGPSSPTVADGKVYIGGVGYRPSPDQSTPVPAGVVRAVNASDGSGVWKVGVPDGHVQSSPTVADGKVFVGTQDGNAYAFNASDGSQLWSFETERGFLSSPTVVDGIVFIGSRWPDNEVHALDAETGEELWSYSAEGVLYSPTVVESTSGSSIGSRVLHGTLGNHDDLRSGEGLVSAELGSIEVVRGGSGGGGDGEDEEVIENFETDDGGGGSGITGFLAIMAVGVVIAVAAAAVSRREQD